ncbi:MAG TPA: type II toxin-antitoxin system prevent-host-death family antitoxin [Pyrinomonadaceae bacterium]|nr:type II toxin-antitoxin system prevent-host-death family antitoxin [Pyrinomonadaceae bacterium]
MTKVNIHEAKSQLSKLIELALSGQEVVIAKAGKPKVRLIPVENEGKSWFGMDEGKGWMADDFNELPEDILELMSDPKIFPDEEDDQGK